MEFDKSWTFYHDNDIQNENYPMIIKMKVIQNEKIDMVKIDFWNLSTSLSYNYYVNNSLQDKKVTQLDDFYGG